MGRAEDRKHNKKVKKQAKAMLTDEQLERVRTATINQEVAEKLSKTWDILGDYFIESMKKHRVGQDRRMAIWKECAAAVERAYKGELKDHE